MTRSERLEQARALAMRPYVLFAFLDQTTDGDTIFVAINPELPSCMAQGETIQEAEEILAEVRIDYIDHLLANGLIVPDPSGPHPVKMNQPDWTLLEPKPIDDDEMTELNLQTSAFAYA